MPASVLGTWGYQRTKQRAPLSSWGSIRVAGGRRQTVNDRPDQAVQYVRGDECDGEGAEGEVQESGGSVGILRRAVTTGASEKVTVEQRLEG